MRGRGVYQYLLCLPGQSPVRAVTMIPSSHRTAAISHRLDLSQPHKTNFHGDDDRLCLAGLNAKDRGRVRSSVRFCYGSHGWLPRRTAANGEGLMNPKYSIFAEIPRPLNYLLEGILLTCRNSSTNIKAINAFLDGMGDGSWNYAGNISWYL